MAGCDNGTGSTSSSVLLCLRLHDDEEIRPRRSTSEGATEGATECALL